MKEISIFLPKKKPFLLKEEEANERRRAETGNDVKLDRKSEYRYVWKSVRNEEVAMLLHSQKENVKEVFFPYKYLLRSRSYRVEQNCESKINILLM